MADAGRYSHVISTGSERDLLARGCGYRLEHFSFLNGLGDEVFGYLLLPKEVTFPAPAVLYHHEHGGKYPLGKDAALKVRENGYAPGIELAKAGFVVMAIDAYGFCEREHQGPAGKQESGFGTELSLFEKLPLGRPDALGHDGAR